MPEVDVTQIFSSELQADSRHIQLNIQSYLLPTDRHLLETLLFQETIPLGVCTAARETAGTAHQRDIKPKDALSTFKRRIASYLSQWNIWAHIPHSLEKLLLH